MRNRRVGGCLTSLPPASRRGVTERPILSLGVCVRGLHNSLCVCVPVCVCVCDTRQSVCECAIHSSPRSSVIAFNGARCADEGEAIHTERERQREWPALDEANAMYSEFLSSMPCQQLSHRSMTTTAVCWQTATA